MVYQRLLKLSGAVRAAVQAAFLFSCLASSSVTLLGQPGISSTTLQLSHTLQPRKIEPWVYRKFIPANTMVKVVDENGTEARMPINEVSLTAGRKTVGYNDRIVPLEQASSNSLATRVASEFANTNKIKVIPELHLQRLIASGEDKCYRIMFNSELPFKFDKVTGIFSSSIRFLIAEEPLGPTDALDNPISLEVTSNSIHGIDPNTVTLSHLYTPSSLVALTDESLLDSALVKIVTRFNPAGYETYVDVIPALQVSSGRRSIQGLGVQTVPITVRFLGSSSSESTSVSLQAEQGTLTPNTINVKFNEPQTVTLRSEGIGTISVVALGFNQQSSVNITYDFPWWFLLFSMVGGLLGATLKNLTAEGTSKWAKSLIVGMLVGLLVAIAYYLLGLNLLGVEISATLNQFAVLGISFVGSYLGIKKSAT